ncbi:hypothetical protein NDU88_003099 [Pleurodeles waltl]|uniref:Uncharacterized protein n=1 Tax=Pleurodeles waltl TaxID=8319 RepID=A0AAV7SCU4_PLEWA|nr:hypothetical protein NDU88_003099 [Pleurodeles waltl]
MPAGHVCPISDGAHRYRALLGPAAPEEGIAVIMTYSRLRHNSDSLDSRPDSQLSTSTTLVSRLGGASTHYRGGSGSA